jgi:bifunctional non-homologous end joining protein LigD
MESRADRRSPKEGRSIGTRIARKAGALEAPFPKTTRPQLATLVDGPPAGPGWLHEIKFDRYRTLCRIDNKEARLYTRNNFDWTGRYGPVADALSGLSFRQAIIDG